MKGSPCMPACVRMCMGVAVACDRVLGCRCEVALLSSTLLIPGEVPEGDALHSVRLYFPFSCQHYRVV